MLVHAFDLSAQDRQKQVGLCESEVSQSYTSCLKKLFFYVHVCVPLWVEVRDWHWVSSSTTSYLIFGDSLSLTLDLMWLAWLASISISPVLSFVPDFFT